MEKRDGKRLKCVNCHFQTSHPSYKIDMPKITKGYSCGGCCHGEKAFDMKDKRTQSSSFMY